MLLYPLNPISKSVYTYQRGKCCPVSPSLFLCLVSPDLPTGAKVTSVAVCRTLPPCLGPLACKDCLDK